MKKCIFFDRDGIINRRRVSDYVKKWDEFEFLDKFFEIYKYFNNQDFLKIIITNQQGVGKGLMSIEDLDDIHSRMQNEIKSRASFGFDDIFYCTSLASENSQRRKPRPAMILEAAQKWNIDLGKSWMIGDALTDIEAGNSAGCRTIYIGKEVPRKCDYAFRDLKELASHITEIDF